MKYFTLYIVLFFYSVCTQAQATFTSINAGNWTTAASWSFTGSDADGIPDGDDNVIIAEGKNITITSTVNCATLSSTFNDGSVTTTATLALSTNGILNISGNTNITDGTNANEKFLILISSSSARLNFNGPVVFNPSASDKIELTFTNSGQVTFNNSVDLGDSRINNSGIAGRNGIVNFKNTSKTVLPVTQNSKFPKIHIYTTDTLVLGGNLISSNQSGDFKIFSGVLDNDGFSMTSGKTFTLNTGCTFILRGTSTYPTSYTTDSFYTGTHVMYVGASQSVAAKSYSTLTIDGSGTKTLAGTATVSTALNLNNGTFDLNNQNFSFLSTASNHAMLHPNGGSMTNTSNLELQRFVQDEGYALIGIPASGAEIEDLDDDFNLYNMTGASPGGGFSNWFTYNEASSSFDSPTTTATLLTVGNGYLTYIENGNVTLDVSGRTPFTSSSLVKNGFGNTGDGFAFLANPYNAVVGFDADNISNLVTAGYKVNVTKDGYDAILAASTPTTYLSPWQGIWIQSTGSNGSYTFNATDIKDTENDAFNLRSTNSEDPLLKDLLEIKLIDNNREDILYIKAADAAEDGFDITFDLEKFNNVAGQGNVVALVDNYKLSVNTLKYDSNYKEVMIAVFTDFPSNSIKNYTLKLKPSKSFMNNNTCYKLLDLTTNEAYTISNNELAINFSQNDNITTPRFKLIYHKPIHLSATDISCYNAQNGQLIAANPNQEPLTFTWLLNGSTIKQTTKSTSDTLIAKTPGTYTLEQSGNSSCPTIMLQQVISQPQKLNATYQLSTDTVNFDLNESTTLTTVADSNISILVTLPDGSSLSNPSTLSIIAAQPGFNNILVSVSDNNCTYTDTLTFFAISSASVEENALKSNFKISVYQNNLTIEKLHQPNQPYSVKLLDLSSKTLFEQATISGNWSQQLKFAPGIYLVVLSEGQNVFTQKVHIF